MFEMMVLSIENIYFYHKNRIKPLSRKDSKQNKGKYENLNLEIKF